MQRLLLLFIVTAGFAFRLATFQSPLLDHHSWRQSDTATIARNFVRTGIHPLYPEIDARGAQVHGYVETGLEAHAVLTAAVSRVLGFSVPLMRLLSCFCFLATVGLLARFLRVRHGRVVMLCGVFVYALCLPLVIYADRAVWNEPILLFLSVALFASAQAYLSGRSVATLVLAALCLCLIGLIKPPWLVQFLVILGLWLEVYGRRALLRWEIWTMGAAALVLVALWFGHMRMVAATTGLTFGTTDKLFTLDDMSAHYAWVVLRRLLRDILLPVGLVAFAFGLIRQIRRRRWAEALGCAGFLIYLVAASRGNRAHDYYQLAIAPVALITIPVGVPALGLYLRKLARPSVRWRPVTVTAIILWVMFVSCIVRSVSFHSWYEVDTAKSEFCSELAPLLGRDERVVFVGYNSPDLLFCLDRRGWLLTDSEISASRLNGFTSAGAGVVVAPARWNPPEWFPRNQLVANTDWIAYRVGGP